MSIKSVCVFAGASDRAEQKYLAAARQLGEMIANLNLELVYGAGRSGLMGQLAAGAASKGGSIFGVTTHLLVGLEGVSNNEITELHVVETMQTRKDLMFKQADAFLIMPGGFGTLDELFEVLTYKQLNYHQKPVIIVNMDGFWHLMVEQFKAMAKTACLREELLSLYDVASSVEDAIHKLEKLLGRASVQYEQQVTL